MGVIKMLNVLKRTVALSLVLMLIVSSISGCGKKEAVTKETDTQGTTNAVTENKEETATTKEKPSGKIVVWGWEFIEKSTSANLEAFKAEYPDIEIEFQINDTANVYQKMLLGLSAGGEGLPDVATIETSHLGQFVQVGGLMDLTEKVSPYVDKMNSFKWADATKDGKIYAMPWDSGPVALYYRTDVFEAAGLPSEPSEVSELLKTWDDYYTVAKTIKEKTGAFMFSESQEQSTGRNFEKLLWQQGSFYFDQNGEPQLNSEAAIKAMSFVTRFVKEDLAENTQEWTQPWYDGFNNGAVATMIGACWMAGFLQSWIAADSTGLWRIIPLPTWDGSAIQSSNDGGSNFVIPDTSKNKEAAWAYVEFMLGREASQIAMFKETDVFPSLETTYTDAFYDEELAYFGNQKIRRIFADTVSEIPVLQYTQHYSQANESLKEAYAKIIFNNMSVEDALNEANEQVKAKIK